MELSAFLEFKKTSLDRIVREATSLIDMPADEMLMAVGSLAEGLGTTTSDLDLLLLTRRSAADLPDADEISWASADCLVDMRILSAPFIDDLLTRFTQWQQAAWNPTHAAPFTLEQRTLLHRIAVGTELVRSTQQTLSAYSRPDIAALARLKLHVSRHEARTVQVDMAGLRAAGDFRSLAFAAAQLMHLAIDAILAGHHLTNPLAKWRSRLLDEIPDGWHAELGPLRSEPVGDTIWRLLRFPASYAPVDVLDYAYRISAYCRTAFAWAEDVLLRPSETAARAGDLAPPPLPLGSGVPLPFLDFDVDFGIAADSIGLGRLNVFAEPLIVSPTELAAALLFDGETSAEDAERWIAHHHGTSVDSVLLLEKCAAHGLLAGSVSPAS